MHKRKMKQRIHLRAKRAIGQNQFYIETRNKRLAPSFRQVRVGGRSSMVFDVENIKKTVAKMKRQKVRILVEPVQQYWCGWNAVIMDPDGNEFILNEDK